MKLRLLNGLVLTLVLSGGNAIAEEMIETTQVVTDSKRDDIVKLMDLTGAGDLGVQAMKQMMGMFKQSNPEVPAKFWDRVAEEVDPNELVELCIPAYEKHLSHEDIKGLIAFYETPLGRKLVETQPAIMQECMVAGQQWGMQLGQKIAEELEAEGY